MEHRTVLEAVDTEAVALTEVLRDLDTGDYRRATRCPPWDVAALAVHTIGALHRTVLMLADDAPPTARVSAAGYYRRDARFSAEVDTDRVDSARAAAERHTDPRQIAVVGDDVLRQTRAALRGVPGERVVRTRHGDAMTLTDFLVTRVSELLLHGLDLADALDRAPWTTPRALAVVGHLLTEPADPDALERTGLRGLDLVRAATGRALPGRPGAEALTGTGLRVLALG